MHRTVLLLAFLVGSLASGAALAVIETYEFTDPELEERYQDLSGELRCPKCQNQNIADSNAPIAQDLRKLLHQQLEEGLEGGDCCAVDGANEEDEGVDVLDSIDRLNSEFLAAVSCGQRLCTRPHYKKEKEG